MGQGDEVMTYWLCLCTHYESHMSEEVDSAELFKTRGGAQSAARKFAALPDDREGWRYGETDNENGSWEAWCQSSDGDTWRGTVQEIELQDL